MSNLYRRFVALCHSWPVDMTKDGRDFGQYLRKKLAVVFKDGELTNIDSNYWEPRIQALERIAKDIHLTEHKMMITSSATGADAATARKLVSNDFLAQPVRTREQLFFEDLKSFFASLKPSNEALFKGKPPKT